MLANKADRDQYFLTVNMLTIVQYNDAVASGTHTSTGGSIVIRAFGSTGCLIFISSSASVERLESDLSRLVVVVWVSAR